jgi:hypothetical protein
MTTLIHPPGSLPDAAPKGLADIWIVPAPTQAAQAQAALHTLWQQHSGVLSLTFLITVMLIAFGLWFARDWRGRVLRFALRRLSRRIEREPSALPEPIGAAVMWALARYFGMRPAVDRRLLPAPWQALVQRLDRQRFSSRTEPQDELQIWQQLLSAIALLSRQAPPPKPRAAAHAKATAP